MTEENAERHKITVDSLRSMCDVCHTQIATQQYNGNGQINPGHRTDVGQDDFEECKNGVECML